MIRLSIFSARALALQLCCLGSLVGFSQAQGSSDPGANGGPLGINLDELKDWNPTWVFVDAIKIARPWISQVPNINSPWNTGAYMNLDSNGWPLLQFGQAAGTLMFKELDGHYPSGLYNVYYDGQGVLQYSNDAVLVSANPGHDTIWVSPSDNGIHLKIAQSQAGNHVRNVRVILPGFEQSYQSQQFHPLFLQRLEPFSVLRFMQWQNTNFTTIQNWWQRPTPNTWSQASDIGVCVEYMCELSSITGKAPWFCMPHTASDDFIREFARLTYQSLAPNLPVYVEFSNEVWNSSFSAFQHALWNGTAANLDSNPYNASQKWYAERSVEIFKLWRQEWQNLGGSAAADRIVRVLASQSANPSIGEIIMDWKQSYLEADVLAIAPYFGHDFGTPQNQWSTVWKSNAQILDECRQEIQNVVGPAILGNAQKANARGLTLISYEGGQHLVGTYGAQNTPQLVEKLIDVNRDPGMYQVYRTYLEVWKAAGGKTMVPYTLCGSYTSWGSWGHLEWMDQPLGQAHKFRAMLDWKAAQGGTGPAVAAEVAKYGQGCYGLKIDSQGSPVVGGSFTATLTGAPWWSQAYLFVSTSNSDYFGLPVPFDLGVFGSVGCTLLVGSSTVLQSQASPTGSAAQVLGIPSLPNLAGQKAYLQWAAAMPSSAPLGLALSDALSIKIGN